MILSLAITVRHALAMIKNKQTNKPNLDYLKLQLFIYLFNTRPPESALCKEFFALPEGFI